MEVKPYDKAGDKKAQVEKMFDNIAPSYDLLNRVLTVGIDTVWRKKAINTIDKKNPEHLLDIATGTADVAIEAFRLIKPGHVTGIDISQEMLDVGQTKLEKRQLASKITLKKDDCENLSFGDETFDVATASFGVRNFADLDKGLSEIQRVLKTGGQIVILEFTKPTSFPFKQLFNIYFKNILPVIGKFKSKDSRAYEYLYESVQAFPDNDLFLTRMRSAGFKDCSYKKLSLGICAIYQGYK